MLAKVKLALRISTNAYDDELLDLIGAAVADLRHAGPVIDANPVVTDNVITDWLITDPLTRMAVVTYCRLRFGSPGDYDKLKAAYDEQKAQLSMATGYTIWTK